MSSLSRSSSAVVFILPSLLLVPLFLSLVHGATLREHRLSEPVSYGPSSHIRPPPSAEMLRALRYIQSLSQRTPPDPQTDQDMENVRSMLELAAPARMDRGMEEREEEKDNTQELLQAVLTTLQQTEEHMVPQKTSQKVTASQPRYGIHSIPRPKQQLKLKTSAENYGRSSWVHPDSQRQYRQFPMMFEGVDQEQPLKRTNENAEEQYTPQKLATLQSVFEELSGITTTQANSKRYDDDEDDDLYRQRKMVLEDIMGTDEWTPLEEQVETEEEEQERHGFNRDLDEDDDDDDEEEEVKRSNQPDWFQTGKEEDPEDVAKLVDYYLLQVLEKKEQQQKRQEDSQSESERNEELERKDVDEDENDEEEREIKPLYSSFPESLSQIVKISQKLQIPPEEVLQLLQNDKQKDIFRLPTTYTSARNMRKTLASTPQRQSLKISTPESHGVAQDILNILELVNAAQKTDNQPTRSKTSRYYEREEDGGDYDDTAGEDDELANYLASEMLANGQRSARMRSLRDEERRVYGNLERAVRDYFEKNAPEIKPAKPANAGAGIDNDAMMKILRYLDPERDDDVDETDSEGKSVPEM